VGRFFKPAARRIENPAHDPSSLNFGHFVRRQMRYVPLSAVILLFLAVFSVGADDDSNAYVYKIEMESREGNTVRRIPRDGKLFIQVQFKIKQLRDGACINNVPKDEIVLREDGRPVAQLEIQQPAGSEPLAAVLAMDISGSMDNGGKMDQARRAAGIFLDKLPEKSDVGLILFDHEMRLREPLAGKQGHAAAHRDKLRGFINAAKPHGGTAYLDAAVESLQMLQNAGGRKAVLVMTDGVDLNSKNSLDDVINQARSAQVPVYTIGVGEPGRNEPVTTVLVLDHSGSMLEPADEKDSKPKIKALHEAAGRFADIMRPNARTSVLSFSDRAERATPFTSDKSLIKKRMRDLTASGQTALFDAICDALDTLEADGEDTRKLGKPTGKRALVVLTDGIDNKSRRRDEDVIRSAKEVGVPLYLLGLGRPGELDEVTMQRIADETHGHYYPARNQQELLDTFEDLSIELHDDGIDEASLRQLADETGGKYYLARNVEDLHLRFQEVAADLDTTYIATFASRRPQHDGTARGIDIAVERGGKALSARVRQVYDVHGVVVAEMHPGVYLGILAVLVCLLGVPAGVRRLHRAFGG
jgi:VWFA-related protein